MGTILRLKRHHYVAAISIFLIIVTLIAGTTGCTPRNPSRTEIRDWYDLDGVRRGLAAYYVLMNDLDSSTAGYDEIASPTANGGKGWDPIGGYEVGNVFSGTFDGNGHKICDLFINRTDEKDVALFGTVGSILSMGSIKNLGLVDFTVAGDVNVAGLLAASWLSNSVTNCHATGTVSGSNRVGGLVGFIDEGGTVTASSFTGSIDGDTHVGGLMGENGGGTVMNCYATGTVSGNRVVGGLVGWHADGSVINCHANGSVTGSLFVGGLLGDANNVTDSYATGNVIGNQWVGGLAGTAENVTNCYATGNATGDEAVGGLLGGHPDGTLSCSHATGNVIGDYSGGLVGVNGDMYVSSSRPHGLVGFSDGERPAIRYCYSSGSVSGSKCVGGLVGENHDSVVSDSYSIANVTGGSQVGGLVGWNYAGTVTNCYSAGIIAGESAVGGLVAENGDTVSSSFWDAEISGQASSDGGIGKTTVQMKSIATFRSADWSITAVAGVDTSDPAYVWNIVDGMTYPFLSWES